MNKRQVKTWSLDLQLAESIAVSPAVSFFTPDSVSLELQSPDAGSAALALCGNQGQGEHIGEEDKWPLSTSFPLVCEEVWRRALRRPSSLCFWVPADDEDLELQTVLSGSTKRPFIWWFLASAWRWSAGGKTKRTCSYLVTSSFLFRVLFDIWWHLTYIMQPPTL